MVSDSRLKLFYLRKQLRLSDVIPPNDMSLFVYAAEGDILRKLASDADQRPGVMFSDLQFNSPGMQTFHARRMRTPLGQKGRFVELKPGDPIPSYARLSTFGFSVGYTYFVPSFEELFLQSEATWLRLLFMGDKTLPGILDLFVISLHSDETRTLKLFSGNIAFAQTFKISADW